jgi:head-tail adaptor
MAKKRSSGDLRHLYAFDKRVDIDRGDGVTVGKWQEQCTGRAGVINLRGGETVIASRLQGRSPKIVFVRATSATRKISTDWRMRDVRTGQIVDDPAGDMVDGKKWTGVSYNVSEIIFSEDRAWVDCLGQSGGADG